MVLVSEGMGEEDCDGEDAADEVGDGDDDWGWKTFAFALRGLVPMGGIGAVGADGAGPSESLSPGLGLLVLQLVTPNISGTKGNFGAIP